MKKYAEYLESSGLKKFVGELKGCMLVCYCELSERCHGDMLIELADGVERKERLLNNEDFQALGTTDDFAPQKDKRDNLPQ